MYQYVWDAETNGLLLTTEQSKFSKEPRPVYYRELDILGFDQYWTYPKDDSAPLLWAEANNYIYKGRTVARTKGGALYTKPEIILVEDPEPNGAPLQFVDITAMCEKNQILMETLVQETIQNIYNTYQQYQTKIDVFYVAFSGGKDSVVVLDLVQRALPHDDFKVLFGDTQMEFPDTYEVVERTQVQCQERGITFLRAKSELKPCDTWQMFGPPATSNRWCCSVHKTSPQINLLKKITGKTSFTGMAFTGIRAEESTSRSNYDSVTEGQKHTGQYSCHAILEWSSAELYLYIFANKLIFNKSYLSGNVRAGCLVCPNSTGKNDYIKRVCYKEEVDSYLRVIATTSAKTNYSDADMKDFIESGFWRTRRSGKTLNFGTDEFEINLKGKHPVITVYRTEFEWMDWAKTVGPVIQMEKNLFGIKYKDKVYQISIEQEENICKFNLINTEKTKDDIKFTSLFRSVIVKSLYCIACGVCEAECKFGCISTQGGLTIGDNCAHCYKCHDIHEHCLRYNSIRNKISEEMTMNGKKLNGYDGHGPREEWYASYVRYQGGSEFWDTDGDGLVVNKKKDKFRSFLQDAGMITGKAKDPKPTNFSDTVVKMGAQSETAWALMLVNLVHNSVDYRWYINNLEVGNEYTGDMLKQMLEPETPNDAKGHVKENINNFMKIALAKTPLGTAPIFASVDAKIKITKNGNEQISLNSMQKVSWINPVPEVILYALYKFAEACGDYYQFSLETLMDDSIERDGVSPSRLFGLDRDDMVRILNGLSINYPEFISASFTLDLDNITLRDEKSSEDVLALF